jgi:PAS domain S-box-containing protein
MQMTNKVAHQLFGYTKTELRGKNISILLPPIIAEQHTGYIRSYISTGTQAASA